MNRLDPGGPRTTLPPLPKHRLLAYVLGGTAFTVAVVTVLWWAGTHGLTGHELVTARLDALRVGLSIAVGGGGGFALYLAWRRQRATEVELDNRERALAHQERAATATETDAGIRRVTDMYTKSAELLGSDKAAVRLAGMYALERLAQDNPEQRATIVAVWCGYLRMPFTPPDDDAPSEELEVRRTVQRLLRDHLRPAKPGFWPGMGLDLTGATLVKLDLGDCVVDWAQFRTATFVGPVLFRGTTFGDRGSAGFARATFLDDANFEKVTFRSNAVFRLTTFTGRARFTDATFANPPNLTDTTFRDGTPPEL